VRPDPDQRAAARCRRAGTVKGARAQATIPPALHARRDAAAPAKPTGVRAALVSVGLVAIALVSFALVAIAFIPVATILAVSVTPARAATEDRPGTIQVERILSRLATGGAREARFVERKFLQILDAPIESSGRLAFKPPGRLERVTEKPKTETLVLDGETLSMTRDGRTRTIAASQLPAVGALVGSLRDVLAGDSTAIGRRFKPIAQGTDQHWQLVLLPSDPDLAQLVTRIVVQGREGRIDTIEILQADGDRSLMSLEAS
jgi:outer membrane lipoprotein-sorting protein